MLPVLGRDAQVLEDRVVHDKLDLVVDGPLGQALRIRQKLLVLNIR